MRLRTLALCLVHYVVGAHYYVGGHFARVDEYASAVLALRTVADEGFLLENTLSFLENATFKGECPDACCDEAEVVDFVTNAVKHDIIAFFGPSCSSTVVQTAPILVEASITQILFSATSTVLSDYSRYPFVVRTIPSDTAQANVMSKLVEWFGWQKIAVFMSDDVYGSDGGEEVSKLLGSRVGKKIILPLSPSQSSLESSLADCRTESISIFVFFSHIKLTVSILEAMYDAKMYGSNYALLFSEANASPMIFPTNKALQAGKGGLILTPAPGSDSRKQIEFPYMFAEAYPASSPGAYGAFVFDAVLLVAHALEASLETSSENIWEVFDSQIRLVPIEGASGNIMFDSDTNDRLNGFTYSVVNARHHRALISVGEVGDQVIIQGAITWPGGGNIAPSNHRYQIAAGLSGEIVDPIYNGMMLALEEINYNGLLGGGDVLEIPASMLRYPACNKEGGSTVAAAWASWDPRPIAAVAVYCSVVYTGMAPLLKDLPVLSWGSTSMALADETTYPMFLQLAPNDWAQVRFSVDLFLLLGWRRLGIINTADTYGQSGAEAMREFALQKGMVVAASRSVQFNDRAALTAAITAFRRHQISLIYLPVTTPVQIAQILSAFQDVGYRDDVVFFGGDSFATLHLEIDSTNNLMANRVLFTSLGAVESLDGYHANYTERYGQRGGIWDAFAYDGVYAIAHGIRNAKEAGLLPNSMNVMAALRQSAGFAGATGKVSWWPGTNNRVGAPISVFSIVSTAGGAGGGVYGVHEVEVGDASVILEKGFNPTACAQGTVWQPTIGCWPCESGTFARLHATACVACPAGTVCHLAAPAPVFLKEESPSAVIVETGPMLDEKTRIYLSALYGSLAVVFIIITLVVYFVLPRRITVLLSYLDLFSRYHIQAIPGPLNLRKTAIGGAFTCLTLSTAFLLNAFLIHRHTLDRFEIAQSIQSGVYKIENPNPLNIEVTFEGLDEAHDCSVCGGMNASIPGSFSCRSHPDTSACTVSFVSKDHQLPSAAQLALGFPRARAQMVRIHLWSEAIYGDDPFRATFMVHPEADHVLFGSRPSRVVFIVQPVSFVALDDIGRSSRRVTSGYMPFLKEASTGSTRDAYTYFDAYGKDDGALLDLEFIVPDTVSEFVVRSRSGLIELLGLASATTSLVIFLYRGMLFVTEMSFKRMKVAVERNTAASHPGELEGVRVARVHSKPEMNGPVAPIASLLREDEADLPPRRRSLYSSYEADGNAEDCDNSKASPRSFTTASASRKNSTGHSSRLRDRMRSGATEEQERISIEGNKERRKSDGRRKSEVAEEQRESRKSEGAEGDRERRQSEAVEGPHVQSPAKQQRTAAEQANKPLGEARSFKLPPIEARTSSS